MGRKLWFLRHQFTSLVSFFLPVGLSVNTGNVFHFIAVGIREEWHCGWLQTDFIDKHRNAYAHHENVKEPKMIAVRDWRLPFNWRCCCWFSSLLFAALIGSPFRKDTINNHPNASALAFTTMLWAKCLFHTCFYEGTSCLLHFPVLTLQHREGALWLVLFVTNLLTSTNASLTDSPVDAEMAPF